MFPPTSDFRSPLLLRWVRFAAWLPLALVVGLVMGIALTGRGTALPGGGRDGGPVWAQWLLMSGNGFLLSWALFFQRVEARHRIRSEPPREVGVVPGVGGVIILTLALTQYADSEELIGLTIVIFAPTLLLGYGLVGWGLPRLKRIWHVAAVLVGVALVNFLCQLGYAAGGFDDARPLTFSSVFLGACFAVRLAIWWLTDEGHVPVT